MMKKKTWNAGCMILISLMICNAYFIHPYRKMDADTCRDCNDQSDRRRKA